MTRHGNFSMPRCAASARKKWMFSRSAIKARPGSTELMRTEMVGGLVLLSHAESRTKRMRAVEVLLGLARMHPSQDRRCGRCSIQVEPFQEKSRFKGFVASLLMKMRTAKKPKEPDSSVIMIRKKIYLPQFEPNQEFLRFSFDGSRA